MIRPTSGAHYPQSWTSSAHIRSLSLSTARVGAPTIYKLAVLTHLEALTPGTRIAIPSIDPVFARRRTSINIVLEGGTDSVLSNNSESIEKSGVKTVAGENGALASLYGRIDIDSSPAVRDQLIALLHAPHPSAVSIDLSGVTHIDSSGVATLIEALKIARNCETELRLQGLHGRLHHLFQATGILSLFNDGIRR